MDVERLRVQTLARNLSKRIEEQLAKEGREMRYDEAEGRYVIARIDDPPSTLKSSQE